MQGKIEISTFLRQEAISHYSTQSQLVTSNLIAKNSLISLSCCRRGGVEGHCGNHHRDGCHHLPAAGGEEEVSGATSLHLRQVPALGPGVPLHPPLLRVVRPHLLLPANQGTPHRKARGKLSLR